MPSHPKLWSSPNDISNSHMARTPDAGTGIIADKDFQPGERVLRIERPFLVVPDSSKLKVTCSQCFVVDIKRLDEDERESIKLKKCGGCGILRFCSPTCQAKSWKTRHKYECKVYKQLYPNVLPNTVRMVLQILLLQENNALPPSESSSFFGLKHHLDYWKSATSPATKETWENIQLMARAAKEYSKSSLSLDLIEAMFGRLLINTLTLVTENFDPLGLALSPYPSLLNHSCSPNAVVTFSGPSLSVRALTPIPKSTEVTISYIDNTNESSLRLAELRTRYFFTCTCPFCVAGCTLSLSNPDPPPALIAELSSTALMEFDRQVLVALHQARSQPSSAVSILGQALSLFPSAYPLYRQPFAWLRLEFFVALLHDSRWEAGIIQSLIIYFSINPVLYPQIFHPVRVVQSWALLKQILQIGALCAEGRNESQRFVEWAGLDLGVVVEGLGREVLGHVGMSHGDDSRLTKEVREGLKGIREDMGERIVSEEEVKEEWSRLKRVNEEGWNWWSKEETAKTMAPHKTR